ncbi:MAG: FAD binding domain-containing protein, partial [Chloroflexi bacterium]|nr:FAD binding domain-containing protein [Chloroflexota bacterium]
MIPTAFDYQRAASVAEAIELLQAANGEARLLAGGHSLLPMMKLRLSEPAILIDIGRIADLRGIEANGDGIRIGATTTHSELERSDLLHDRCPILSDAAGMIGDPQVRNRGTIGGSLAHSDPGADLPAVVVALDAT